jgi:hypothetical protein
MNCCITGQTVPLHLSDYLNVGLDGIQR